MEPTMMTRQGGGGGGEVSSRQRQFSAGRPNHKPESYSLPVGSGGKGGIQQSTNTSSSHYRRRRRPWEEEEQPRRRIPTRIKRGRWWLCRRRGHAREWPPGRSTCSSGPPSASATTSPSRSTGSPATSPPSATRPRRPPTSPSAATSQFDGDGMIHAMRIKDGKATYVSRYVKTSRLKQEEYFGGAKFMKIGDLKGFFGLFMVQMQQLRKKLKVLDFTYGSGTANTALIYHHGKLMALSEVDKPYVVKVLEDGDLQTLGLLDYDKRLKHSFTAHPKVDPFTDEMFTFGYSHEPPYCTYRVITKDGVMLDPVPITIPESVMMHDFAITENYSIFMDLPLLFRPKEMVKNGEFIYKFDSTKKARFGILPRYEKDDKHIRWFELPNCFIFHNANSWEEGDEVILITCRLENPDLEKVNLGDDKLEDLGDELYEMRFNIKTGTASQKQLSVSAIDFPRINESYTGRKQRYVYCTILDSIAKVTGIIKFDLHAEPESGKKQLEVGGNVRGIYDLGPGRFGSEAVFVPKQPGVSGEEDDGYLIFFVHDENTGKSEVNVIDAKTMSADPVAVVELPNRVPYGFHALFVNEEQLAQQAEEQ